MDIVLKFPNPSDAADALVKDKMVRFRSEELIKKYGRCYDVNRICQRYRYLNVVVLQITSLSLSLSFFGSLYIYTCTYYVQLCTCRFAFKFGTPFKCHRRQDTDGHNRRGVMK